MLHRPLLRSSFAALACFAATACGGASDDPAAVADAFWSALEAGDGERAVALVREADRAEFPEMGVEDATFDARAVGDPKVSGDTASQLTVIEEGELEFTCSTFLVREDGTWRVNHERTAESMAAGLKAVLEPQLEAAAQAALSELSQGLLDGLGR